MFTGIIEEVGSVIEAGEGSLRIACSIILEGTNLGDSIAINGVDLTVVGMDSESLAFNCMPETYRRSNLGQLEPGNPVNLERSLLPTTRLSGHLVRGVVEATGTLISLAPEGDAILARYSAPPDILRHTVVKGPITIDGVSLTGVSQRHRAEQRGLVVLWTAQAVVTAHQRIDPSKGAHRHRDRFPVGRAPRPGWPQSDRSRRETAGAG